VKSTREVFECLMQSLFEAQDFILEVNGHLTTLTVCVILPLADDEERKDKFVACAINVGDSLAYVYGKNGVRELTQGSLLWSINVSFIIKLCFFSSSSKYSIT
jgi:serine/threonine protein phosphatase PrpC